MSSVQMLQGIMIAKQEIWVEGFSADAVPGDENIPWAIMGMECNEIPSHWGEGGKAPWG